jgi:uncharacterized protein (DUF1800 family)
MDDSPHDTGTGQIAAAVAVAGGALLLAGCGGGGGGNSGPGATPPALTFTGISVAATTSTAATITIANVAADVSGAVRFALPSGTGASTRSADPGHRQAEIDYAFAVNATAGISSATADVHVVLNPAPDRVITGAPAQTIRHLFNRISFGVSEEDLGRWQHIPYATAVHRIIDETTYELTSQAKPAAASYRPLTWRAYSNLSPAAQEAYNSRKGNLIDEITRWWLREIVISRQALLERMALFWHNLLVTSVSEFFEPRASWDYLDLLRRHALGSFRDLIHGIARDPAMVMYLDSTSNVAGSPNENFARELMELFTLGENQVYTEQDVVEVAKCFTGWGLDDSDARNQDFRYWQDRHEPGQKTVLGTTINTSDADPEQVRKDGEAVINTILAQNRVAVYLCEKLWDEFIGGTRDTSAIAVWAGILRTGNYQIRPVLKAIFTHTAFTNTSAHGNMVRSPIELIGALFRAVNLEPDDYTSYFWRASEEDQRLLSPPNVRGWVGGLDWISTSSLMERRTHLSWTNWELHNSGNHKIPERLDDFLEMVWFATPPADSVYIAAAAADVPWNPRGERIRRLLLDPAINCK